MDVTSWIVAKIRLPVPVPVPVLESQRRDLCDAQVEITHVAYQGNAQATTDRLGGTSQMGFVNFPVALQFVKNGKLKALAVTPAKRSPLLPDVPTVAEALGVADYELTGWFGLLAPARTPPEIVARLQEETSRALRDPALVETIRVAGCEVVGGSSSQFEARMKRDAGVGCSRQVKVRRRGTGGESLAKS